jgi:hypothetical protein
VFRPAEKGRKLLLRQNGANAIFSSPLTLKTAVV